MDSVAAQLPPNVAVKGFLDAAALLNIQPTGWEWSTQLETLQSLVAKVAANIGPVFPSYCATNFPGEEWKCLIGQYRMPLIRSMPYFINAPQFDEFELMYDTDNFAPATPAQLAFVDQFQSGTRSLIASLPAGTGVFSPTCLVHCLSGQTTFADLLVDGSSFVSAVSGWYFDGTPTQVVSQCNGWACINQCGIFADGSQGAGLPCNMGDQNCVPVQLATDVNGVVTEPTGQAAGSSQGSSEWAATAVSTTPAAVPIPAPVAQVQPVAQPQVQPVQPQPQQAQQGAAPNPQLQAQAQQAQAQAQTLAASLAMCLQQCQAQQSAQQAQVCINQCSSQYNLLMSQVNPALLATTPTLAPVQQQAPGQPEAAPAPLAQPMAQPMAQPAPQELPMAQPMAAFVEAPEPQPEPQPVAATEESLSEEQKALMTRLTSLSTMRRLFSAAPACCNGRAAYD
jgi:hypothetical protein